METVSVFSRTAQVAPLFAGQFGQLDDGIIEMCWFLGTTNAWRLVFYGPLMLYMLFALYLLVHTARTRSIKSARSRKKVLRRMMLVVFMFLGMWLAP